MKVYIVIPTFNEAENIEELIQQILSLHPDFNIIIVDDNSPDGTGAVSDAISNNDSRISVIHRPKKTGLGTAYIEGFKKALDENADLIFEMDADFSHNPEYLQDFLTASENADLVIGSRYLNGVRIEGWSFRRLMLSKFANIFAARIMLRPIWDFTSGFRCYRREVLQRIVKEKIKSDGYAFQIEMIYFACMNEFRIKEIPIIFRERKSGYSKLSKHIKWEAFWLVLKCHAPLLRHLKYLRFAFEDSGNFFDRISKKR